MFPPIGAQGLNLGIRDIDDLIGIASESRSDPGSEKCLTAYDTRRRPDILARSSAVNLLNRSLLSDMVPMQYNAQQWIAYWNYLEHPQKPPIFGYQLPTWWRKPN